MAISINDLSDLMVQAGLTAGDRAKVLKEARELEESKKTGSAPKQKYKLTVLVRGDDALEATLAQAFVVKTPEDQDDDTLVDRLKLAGARHNQNAKRKKSIVATFADVFRTVKRKTTKETDINVAILSKEPVRVVVLKSEQLDLP